MNKGDMAVIIGANTLTENIGKSVTLVQFIQDNDFYVGPNGNFYLHSDVPCWVVIGDDCVFRTEDGVLPGFAICEPRHLRIIGQRAAMLHDRGERTA